MINIDNKYDIGQLVYVITDSDQQRRIVTAIKITKGDLFYELSCGVSTSWHYDYELSEEVNVSAL